MCLFSSEAFAQCANGRCGNNYGRSYSRGYSGGYSGGYTNYVPTYNFNNRGVRYLPILPKAPVYSNPIPSPHGAILPIARDPYNPASRFFYGGREYSTYRDAVAARTAVQNAYIGSMYLNPGYRW